MPVIGKVNAVPEETSIEKMVIGTKAYLCVDYIVVTRKYIFVYFTVPVTIDDDDDEMYQYVDCITIKRIGPGLTEADFELDFREFNALEITLEPSCVEDKLLKEKDQCLIFTDFEIGKNHKDESVEEKTTLEKLQSRLDKALEDQDFPRAAKIRDKIAIEKNKEKKEKDK